MSNYLYNDIELPALPEYDKEQYPYAFIGKTIENDQYSLYVSATPFTYSGVIVKASSIQFETAMLYRLSGNEWELIAESATAEYTLTAYITGTELAAVIWSSHDIINKKDNSIYFEGSDPVPVGGEPTLTECDFYKVINGAWVKCDSYQRVTVTGQPTGEPVAYLYNDVKLPALPEWDKTAYPYAFITGVTSNNKVGYYLYCTEVQLAHNGRAMSVGGTSSEFFDFIRSTLQKDGVNDDNPVMADPSTTKAIIATGLVWGNYDIYNDDGTLRLAASDPVPVYDSTHSTAWVKQDEYRYE